MFQKTIKEPLAQFLVLGTFLYLTANFLGSGVSPLSLGGGDNEIVITDKTLVEYLQFQRKSFNQKKAQQLLSMMPKTAKEQLVSSYIRDEVLFREAMSLGLDTNDEIIRRRLIQKMEYLAQGFYDDLPEMSEDELKQFFNENQNRYLIEPAVTFTHIFFRQGEEAEPKALKQLDFLIEKNTSFENAGQYGDRFLYHQNYVDRSSDFIESHFSKNFQRQLFSLETGTIWQGPLESNYGYHLVQVIKNTPTRMPSLDEIAHIVLGDARREKERKLKSDAIDKLIEKYSIVSQ
ncbi:MAG: peptidyl-prolyl cis-trans isomerase [Pseudomonadales bacterium]|nr:peptidyl-prolyl cis-trans isomerase [Pseudomonadales bacterium]